MNDTAAYIRVSSRDQNDRLQRQALRAWAEAKGIALRWYTDRFTGKTMDRPGWAKLEQDLAAGKVGKIAVWKLDRLGRTAAGLTKLFEEFQARKTGFVSLTEGIDLSTATGRMVANILASVAEFEREVRAERQRAGIQASREEHRDLKKARKHLTDNQIEAIEEAHRDGLTPVQIAKGLSVDVSLVHAVAGKCPWGGSRKGVAKKLNADQITTIKKLKAGGQTVASIAQVVGISRPTVYSVLRGDVSA